jgi:ribosomal protein L31
MIFGFHEFFNGKRKSMTTAKRVNRSSHEFGSKLDAKGNVADQGGFKKTGL